MCCLREELVCRYFPTLLIVLLAVFNDGAMIALSTDRVREAPVPYRWVLGTIFLEGKCIHPLNQTWAACFHLSSMLVG